MINNFFIVILNIVNPVVFYIIFTSFLKYEKYSKKITIFSYLIFYLITTTVLIFVSKTFYNALSNFLSMLLLTCIYKGKFIYKFFVVSLTYVFVVLIELIVSISFYKFNLNIYNLYLDVNFAYIFAKLLLLTIAGIIFINFSHISKIKVPPYIVLILSIVPILSILIVILETIRKPVSDNYFLLSSVLLLVINTSIFIIFNILTNLYVDRERLQNINQESNLLDLQKNNIEASRKKLATLEHDLKNKLVPLYYLAENRDNVSEYLSEIIGEFNKEFLISNTDIVEVDAIINSKYEVCKAKNISFDFNTNIGKDININYRDLAIILGNLLDNAIEATLMVEDKWIKLVLREEIGVVFIMVDNSYDGKVIEKNGSFVSRKNKEYCGIGLQNVAYLADRYKGVIKFTPEKNKFRVSLMLYQNIE